VAARGTRGPGRRSGGGAAVAGLRAAQRSRRGGGRARRRGAHLGDGAAPRTSPPAVALHADAGVVVASNGAVWPYSETQRLRGHGRPADADRPGEQEYRHASHAGSGLLEELPLEVVRVTEGDHRRPERIGLRAAVGYVRAIE